MDVSAEVQLLIASITAIVTLIGYLVNQAANRRISKQKLYAEALSAVREYEELPYRIARRGGSNCAIRSAIGDIESAVYVKLGLYRSWLQIEDREVGAAYVALLNKAHKSCVANRLEAWSSPLISNDRDAYLYRAYTFNNEAEWALSTLIMKRHLSPMSAFYRRGSRLMIEKVTGQPMPPKQQAIDPKTPASLGGTT